MKYLAVKIGAKFRILSILNKNIPFRQRLLALGFLPGTELEVTQIAPLGDPIELLVKGCAISLRQEELNMLVTEEVK